MPDDVIEESSGSECCAIEALMGIVFLCAFLAVAGYSAFWAVTRGAEALSRFLN